MFAERALGPFGLLQGRTGDGVSDKAQRFMSHCWGAGGLQSGSGDESLSLWWKRPESPLQPLTRTLTPFPLIPSWASTLTTSSSQSPPPHTSTWGLGFPHANLGGTRTLTQRKRLLCSSPVLTQAVAVN